MMTSPTKGLVALNGIFCMIESKQLHEYELTKMHNGAFRKYQIPNPKFGTRGPNLGFWIWCLVHTPPENTKSQMARAIFGDGRKSRAILCYG